MVRIWPELNDAFFLEFVDDPLNALPVDPHGPGMPGDRLRIVRICNGSKYLPSRTCQPKFGNQAVTGKLQPAIEPEHIQYQRCHRFSRFASLFVWHAGSSKN